MFRYKVLYTFQSVFLSLRPLLNHTSGSQHLIVQQSNLVPTKFGFKCKLACKLIRYQLRYLIFSKEISDGEPSNRNACRFLVRVVLSQYSVRIQSFMLEVTSGSF